jgi:hypothetical protein
MNIGLGFIINKTRAYVHTFMIIMQKILIWTEHLIFECMNIGMGFTINKFYTLAFFFSIRFAPIRGNNPGPVII